MTYSEFLSVLEPYRDGQFAAFQKKIIRPPKADFLGVRTPDMRKIAKKLQADLSDIFSFPDEYYEAAPSVRGGASHLPELTEPPDNGSSLPTISSPEGP